MKPELSSFRLEVPQSDIDDLHSRLARTRFPDHVDVAPWSTGVDLRFMRNLIAHWRNDFDWRRQEARLNALPQYMLRVGQVPVHFIRVEGRCPNPLPLMLGHGWPGSVLEFLKLIPLLTDPVAHGISSRRSFTVVAPSLPGYCLSYEKGLPGLSAQDMAECLNELMGGALGYERYGVQGGDWGASVAACMALQEPGKVAGIHLNFLPLQRNLEWVLRGDEDHREYAAELARWQREEGAYGAIQATKPQTLAHGMSDSPSALAAWMVEKIFAWSDNGGNLESVISLDDVLANISLYWFTNCSNSAFWPYYARAHGPWPIPDGVQVKVPMGYCEFPKEILRPPKTLAARSFSDIRRWTCSDIGGHFAAWEQPRTLAKEIAAFFDLLEDN